LHAHLADASTDTDAANIAAFAIAADASHQNPIRDTSDIALRLMHLLCIQMAMFFMFTILLCILVHFANHALIDLQLPLFVRIWSYHERSCRDWLPKSGP